MSRCTFLPGQICIEAHTAPFGFTSQQMHLLCEQARQSLCWIRRLDCIDESHLLNAPGCFFFYNIGIFEGFEMHSGIEAMQTCLSRAAKPTRWCHLYNLMKIWASVDIAAAGGMSSHCHHNLPRGRGEGGCISPSSSTIYIKTFMMFQRKNVLGAIVRGQWWGNESIDTKYKYSENGNWQYSRFRIT